LSWFHGLQLALAGVAVVSIARALRRRERDDLDALARHLYFLRGLGRMALPLAFVGVIVDLGRGIEEAHAATPAGALAGSAALSRSVVGLTLGACTAVGCLGVATSLRSRLRTLRRAPGRDGDALDRARGGV